MLFREFAAAKLRAEDEDDWRVVQAWQMCNVYAQMLKQKRVPSLKTLLSHRQAGPQSSEQLSGALQVLSGQYGIPLRKAKPRGE